MPRANRRAIPRDAVSAVRCIHCGYAYSKSVSGRQQERGYRRRRVCLKCNTGFVTYEISFHDLNRWEFEGTSPFGATRKGKGTVQSGEETSNSGRRLRCGEDAQVDGEPARKQVVSRSHRPRRWDRPTTPE